jgi:hypothetical protein
VANNEATTVGDDKAQEVAWKDAGADRSGMPPPTGDAVGSADAEKDMIRGMAATHMEPVEEQKKLFRPPSASEAPAERAAPPVREETFEPPVERAAPAARREAAPPPADDEGARLEREYLGGGAPTGLTEIPDTLVKIGGVEMPLTRIRSGLEALARRDEWSAENTRREQALARANDTMVDAAREFHRDPVAAAEKIGIPPERLLEELRKRGLATEEPAAHGKVAELPDDADPLAKGLYAENQALKRKLERVDTEIGGIKQHLSESERHQRAAALQSQNAAALSGVKSELTAAVAKIPSIRLAEGVASPEGKLLVQVVMTQLQQEVAAYGQPVSQDQVRDRAKKLFKEKVDEVGISTKAAQARAALSGDRRNAPTPIRTGTTVPMPAPGGEKQKPGQFDFSNDDARRAAMDSWWEANAAT